MGDRPHGPARWGRGVLGHRGASRPACPAPGRGCVVSDLRPPGGGSRIPLLLRAAVSVGILALLLAFLDHGAILESLRSVELRWVLVVLAITVGQVALLGWRWWYTLDRLGLSLPRRAAVAEYYRSVFLNQVLPGGVLGDVSRAWRHVRVSPEARGVAVRAVILERASGQAVMTFWAAGCVAALGFGWFGARDTVSVGWFGSAAAVGWIAPAVATAVILVGALGVALMVVRIRGDGRSRKPGRDSLMGRIWRDARRGVLSPAAFGVHLLTALLLIASYVAVFVVAALAVGARTEIGMTALLAAPVLMAMLIPISWAGWGVREAAAAGIWALAGLSPTDGVLISAAYGALVLLASLPGGLLLLRPVLTPPSGTPDRRGHPGPA
ncbi:MAG: UPF0104 family protein [Gemmatimonadales bacterium]|nr:MAG: UPF0104 family protein [Gemmatimonadales bacterium]